MERIFQILAVVLAGVAAFFLWGSNSDWAFITGVLAACSFFLSIRYQMKSRLIELERKNSVADAAEIDEETRL